jgi:hypothetical protein
MRFKFLKEQFILARFQLCEEEKNFATSIVTKQESINLT